MVFLGIDVSLGRGLDLASVRGGRVERLWSRVGPQELCELILDLGPEAIGVDAPPKPGLGLLRDEAERSRLPVPPPPGKHLDRRIAEYELSRRGIGSHQTHHDPARLFSWMTAGFEVFAAAAAAGYPTYLGDGTPAGSAFEAFPYASYVALGGCLSPGRRWRLPWRVAVLRQAGLAGLPEDATIDQVDAACAALTAERFIAGKGSWIGDPREGAIVLPVSALADRYHRCAPPDGRGHVREAVVPAAPRLCECGCGAPVRHRFLPGHAARHRARLRAEARAGQAARRELRRLGWADPTTDGG